MPKEYYAKSRLANGHQPTVKEHLDKVSKLAAAFGAQLGMEDEARLTGLLHDFGKYSNRFQDVLRGTAQAIDHALPGAATLYNPKKKCVPKNYRPIVEAINGHHAGLTEASLLESYLKQSRTNERPVEPNDGKMASLAGASEYSEAMQRFSSDFPSFRMHSFSHNTESLANDVEEMLYTRMLFSCLVDADYSVSASDENPSYLLQSEQTPFDPAQLLDRLYQHRDIIRNNSSADPAINKLRDDVFTQCGKMASLDKNLFTLTAPTGVGKTLALLYFALKHCMHTGKRRIIVVLPFLTLIEQIADEYRTIYPNILEDHSLSNLQGAEQEFSARWSAPMIITTSVRFFESLFSRKPGDCRKLHNIANSVILFDEAQSLPPEVTTATLQAVNMLCRRYNCTMVFSTATQPDFSAIQGLEWAPKEIVPEHRILYAKLKRTRVDWRIDAKMPLPQIAEEMLQYESVCVIVNLRRHARALYQQLQQHCKSEELFFLTTDLCPAHRSQVVNTIKKRLEDGQPCRLVSTQCIEAGVDLDFDVLYRALAPLDSIIQAAGRCNRNGRAVKDGRVVVFEPDYESSSTGKSIYPNDWYNNAAVLVKGIWMENDYKLDIHDPEQIRKYYQQLFINAKDRRPLENALQDHSFADVSEEYRLINNNGAMVIVPYEDKMDLYVEVRSEALSKGVTPALLRKAAPICVSTFEIDPHSESSFAEALYYQAKPGQERRRSNCHILRPQYEECYTKDMGLQVSTSSHNDEYIV